MLNCKKYAHQQFLEPRVMSSNYLFSPINGTKKKKKKIFIYNPKQGKNTNSPICKGNSLEFKIVLALY